MRCSKQHNRRTKKEIKGASFCRYHGLRQNEKETMLWNELGISLHISRLLVSAKRTPDRIKTYVWAPMHDSDFVRSHESAQPYTITGSKAVMLKPSRKSMPSKAQIQRRNFHLLHTAF